MSSKEEENQNIYKQPDHQQLEVVKNEEEDDEEEEEDHNNSFSPSTSSDDPNRFSTSTLFAQTPLLPTITVSPIASRYPNGPITDTPPAINDKKLTEEEKKPSSLDESRKLFQRLWTDEDEIGLLQGFLDFNTQRGTLNSSYHHETGPFYDHIKNRLQLDFNKSQLVEKLRRLKKKYRNVVARINSGKDFSFKTPHDLATFEISRKIWGGSFTVAGSGLDETLIEDDDSNIPNVNIINTHIKNNNSPTDFNNSDKKVSTTTPQPQQQQQQRRRSEKRPAEEDLSGNQLNSSIPNVIEDAVRSCLSPLLKELINCATNGQCNLGLGLSGAALNPLPLSFGGNSLMNYSSGEMNKEKWRKQQILELEVYSKRIELVQEQIKIVLEDLRSMGSR